MPDTGFMPDAGPAPREDSRRLVRGPFIAFVTDATSQKVLSDGLADVMPNGLDIRRGGVRGAGGEAVHKGGARKGREARALGLRVQRLLAEELVLENGRVEGRRGGKGAGDLGERRLRGVEGGHGRQRGVLWGRRPA